MSRADFTLVAGPELLARTPALLDAWLRDLSPAWLDADEGPDTWSPAVVIGHLIEGELHDWIPRVRHILEHGERAPFPPFDRFAQLRRAPRPLGEDLDEFAALRAQSLDALRALRLGQADLARTGRHPEFGVVTLGQHLATWITHDLTHVQQIARVMAFGLREAVGPWRSYLRIAREGP